MKLKHIHRREINPSIKSFQLERIGLCAFQYCWIGLQRRSEQKGVQLQLAQIRIFAQIRRTSASNNSSSATKRKVTGSNRLESCHIRFMQRYPLEIL